MKAQNFPKWFALGALGLAAPFLTGATQTAANPTKIQGVLIDQKCSPNAETRVVSGITPHLEGGIVWAYTHTRKCALMPECERSGYGIATHDDRYLKFDAAGNRKALEMLKTSKKEDDLEVQVTGDIQGDTIHVTNIGWQQ